MTAPTGPELRRTRIVCIADTHNCTVKLPAGDVLIHAGDLTNQGSYSELSKTVRWLEAADFEAKIVIAGNHDITLDASFYRQHGDRFHNQAPQDPEACLSLLTSSPSITYLNHSSVTIRLTKVDGPRTEFAIFGSPYSPGRGIWGFSYHDDDTAQGSNMASLWNTIPLDADIVVTHTPPRTHRDATEDGRAAGCEALRRALSRVRPKLAVCGHIHDGRGAERVRWRLDDDDAVFKEDGIRGWSDAGAGSNRLSLVDLTGRRSPALANEGARNHQDHNHDQQRLAHSSWPGDAPTQSSGIEQEISHASTSSQTPPSPADGARPNEQDGLGVASISPSRAYEAPVARLGRRETCIVNAAIMKSRYPHVGGKRFNKPIVVDVMLPAWQSRAVAPRET